MMSLPSSVHEGVLRAHDGCNVSGAGSDAFSTSLFLSGTHVAIPAAVDGGIVLNQYHQAYRGGFRGRSGYSSSGYQRR